MAIDGFSYPPVAWQYKQGKFSYVLHHFLNYQLKFLSSFDRQTFIGVYVYLGVQKWPSVYQKTFREKKTLFAVVSPLRLCTCVTKFRAVILKMKGRTNEKPKFIARFTKKSYENKNKKLPKYVNK